jgi:glycosyltransferase involved in cell wall biosynthesis
LFYQVFWAALPMNNEVLFVGAYPDSVVDFRGDLIRAVCETNCNVSVLTADGGAEVTRKIEVLGVRFIPYSIHRNSLSPRGDLRTLGDLRRIFREKNPEVILAYTIKPIIWGAIAARRVPRARFFAMVTGLGYGFQGDSLKRRLLTALVVRLYRFALRRANKVIFQNADNRDEFVARRIVPAEKCHVVSGSGINTERFSPAPMPDGSLHFLLIARLLGEKGIREYVQAARKVKEKFPDIRFSLVGPEDPSPDGIPIAEVRQWHEQRIINYLGATTDVRPFIQECHVYCLPSYHEGMPRTVLEAMAMARPILTTDVSGCKETVVPGTNGWLVPKADVDALAERIIWFVQNRDQVESMGRASRKIAEEKFDVNKVNAEMMRIMGLNRTE